MNDSASISAGGSPARRAAQSAVPILPKITVSIPTPLRKYCAGKGELLLAAADVRAVLAALERGHAELHRCVCDETGAVRRHINIFINTEHMRDCHGLDTRLEPGDVVTIMTAVSGG